MSRGRRPTSICSPGRLRLGVGIGWNTVEYDALGEDFHTRGARQEEQIPLLRRLFTEPVVDFSGRFDRIDRAALVPKPARSIPIWMGGASAAAYDRAARLADGFIFFSATVDDAIEAWKHVRDRVRAHGRSVEGFGAECVVRARGGLARLAADIDAWRDADGSHVSVVTMGLGLTSLGAQLDYIESVATTLDLS